MMVAQVAFPDPTHAARRGTKFGTHKENPGLPAHTLSALSYPLSCSPPYLRYLNFCLLHRLPMSRPASLAYPVFMRE
jgi:hypothetical protein